jgi:hypothetical protein
VIDAAPRPMSKPLRELLPIALMFVAVVAVARTDGRLPNAPLFFALAIGGFTLLQNSRAWVVAPLLVTELTISDYIVPEIGLSLRLAVALAAIALAFGTVLRGSGLPGGHFRLIVLSGAAFVAVATAVNGTYSDGDYVFKYFRYQFSQLLCLIVVACTIRDRRDLVRLGYVALAFGAASGLASVVQHFDRQSGLYGSGNQAIFNDWKGRSIGLSTTPVTLANAMLFVLAPMAGFIAAGVLPRGRLRLVMIAAFGILFLGLYFTYTRSGLIALGAGVAGSALALSGRRRTIVLGAVVVLYILFELAKGVGVVGGRYTKDATNDRSAASHDALLVVGLAMAADNLAFGIGREHFEEVSAEYAALLEADEAGGSMAVGKERPHNDFLSVVISWGIGALTAYLAVVALTVANCRAAARSRDPLIRGMAVACVCGLMAYLANSAFHNSLDSSTAFWLYAGLSVALARMPDPRPDDRRGRRRVFVPRHRIARRPARRAVPQYAFGG